MHFSTERILGILCASIIFLQCRDNYLKAGCLVLIFVLCTLQIKRRCGNTFRMHRIQTDALNETLVVECLLSKKPYFFVIDTGYAGPLVLNTSYLATKRMPVHRLPRLKHVKDAYISDLKSIESVTEDERNVSASAILKSNSCLAYTSGCTMRLMGIGETTEKQADMLMCEMLSLKTTRGKYAQPKRVSTLNAHADVYVTNHFSSCVHIMTCDFLMHSSPALLSIEKQQLSLHLSEAAVLPIRLQMKMYPARFSGGAFTIDIKISGESFRCTLDTGSPAPVSLGREAARRLTSCKREERKLSQQGVHGEGICSEVITATMTICDREYENVPVFVNDHSVDQTDGYVGLSVLRAFDILILEDGFGLHRNNLEMVSMSSMSNQLPHGMCNVELKCDAGALSER